MTKILQFVFKYTLSSVVFGIVLLLSIAMYVALGSGFPKLREYFEMNEMQFFNAWPLKMLMGLLVATLATVTWIRIPLTPPRYGVWCIHLGIITLVMSTSFHYKHKVEGMTLIPVNATVDHFYDVTERSLYLRVPGRPMGWLPTPSLPRFKTYSPELETASRLQRAELQNIGGFNALDPFTGQEQLRSIGDMVGSPIPVTMDVVAYHPYADVVTTYEQAIASDAMVSQPGLRVSLHSEKDHSDSTRFLISSDPDARQLDLEGVRLEHRHLKDVTEFEDARKASQESLSKLHRLDVNLGAVQQTLNVQVGQTYTLADAGYTLTIESFDPAFPAMNGEIVQLLTMMVKSPTQTFRRQVISTRETPTDWQLGVTGAGPLGKRQTEPLDTQFKTFYLYKDEAGLMPTTGREKVTLVTADGVPEDRVLFVLASTERPAEVRDLTAGEQIELKTDSAVTFAKVERLSHVERSDLVVDVPGELRTSDEGQSGRKQVLMIRVTSGAWSTTVPVPAAQWPLEMVGAWGGPVVQVPGATKPLRLQLGNTMRRLPARVTLDKFELVTFPGGEVGKTNMFRDFKSHLTVEDLHTRTKLQDVAHMNSPVYLESGSGPIRQSWLLFQAQWDPEGQRWSVLGVGSRPGVMVMTVGCVMIGVGLIYAFYAKPYIIRRMKLKALAEHEKKKAGLPAQARSRAEKEVVGS